MHPSTPSTPSPALHRSRFSQDLQALLQRLAEHPLTLGEIVEETSERGFGLVIGLLVLPFLFPMPPGFTGPFGGASLLLALQMALGRRSPWLPRRVAQFQFPTWAAQQLLGSLQRLSQVVEKVARPRLARVVNHPYAWQLSGLCIAWQAFLLILPIPLTNPIPTVGILIFTVALLEQDGFLLCVGFGMTLAITAAVFSIGYALPWIWQFVASLV
jgi:hypothetical protein